MRYVLLHSVCSEVVTFWSSVEDGLRLLAVSFETDHLLRSGVLVATLIDKPVFKSKGIYQLVLLLVERRYSDL